MWVDIGKQMPLSHITWVVLQFLAPELHITGGICVVTVICQSDRTISNWVISLYLRWCLE